MSARFTVTKTEDDPIADEVPDVEVKPAKTYGSVPKKSETGKKGQNGDTKPSVTIRINDAEGKILF